MNTLPRELAYNNDTLPVTTRLVASYPKTGRTWLRFMLANYVRRDESGIGEVDFKNMYRFVPNVPSGQIPGQPEFDIETHAVMASDLIMMTHETHTDGKGYPEASIYLLRKPHDVMVSNWFHRTRQLQQYNGSLSDFIRDPAWGVQSYLDHIESWVSSTPDGNIFTYESLRSNTFSEMQRLLGSLAVDCSPARLDMAIDASTVERMKKSEEKALPAGHNYDVSDPNARRVREARVGGYVNHLAEQDIQYINGVIGDSPDDVKSRWLSD